MNAEENEKFEAKCAEIVNKATEIVRLIGDLLKQVPAPHDLPPTALEVLNKVVWHMTPWVTATMIAEANDLPNMKGRFEFNTTDGVTWQEVPLTNPPRKKKNQRCPDSEPSKDGEGKPSPIPKPLPSSETVELYASGVSKLPPSMYDRRTNAGKMASMSDQYEGDIPPHKGDLSFLGPLHKEIEAQERRLTSPGIPKIEDLAELDAQKVIGWLTRDFYMDHPAAQSPPSVPELMKRWYRMSPEGQREIYDAAGVDY